MSRFKNAFKASGTYRLAVVDFAKEIRRYGKPPCMDLEHRMGQCPMGLDHSVEFIEGKNTVVGWLKYRLIDSMVGIVDPSQDVINKMKVTRIATGTDGSATTQPMTQLVDEYYRAAPSDLIKATSTKLSVYWFFSTAQANAPTDLQEFGILINGADDNFGSGTLAARFLQTFAKNNANTLSGQYDFEVQ